MDGWIKISRSITEHWIFTNPLFFKWWIDMLLMANIKENEVLVGAHVVKLKRGQLIASLGFLATRWNVNKFRVRRFLKLLESENMIVTTYDKKAQQITICNYASYQDVRNDDATIAQPQSNDDATIAQPNIRIKEGKKEIIKKKDKKETDPPSSPKGEISQKLSELILPEFTPVMEEWLQYKRQRKQSYKSDKSIAQCYKNLVKLSNGDPVVAMEIIHQSMANNWSGIFPLKNESSNPNNYGNNNGQGIDPQQLKRQQYERGIKEYVAGQLASLANEGQGCG